MLRRGKEPEWDGLVGIVLAVVVVAAVADVVVAIFAVGVFVAVVDIAWVAEAVVVDGQLRRPVLALEHVPELVLGNSAVSEVPWQWESWAWPAPQFFYLVPKEFY